MLPLFRRTIPEAAATLEQTLRQSLARLFLVNSETIVLTAPHFPEIAQLEISLDHARLRYDAPPPSAGSGEGDPAFAIQLLDLHGANMAIGPAVVDLKLTASDVLLAQTRDASGDLVLVPKSAADGSIEISSAITEIEAAVAALARKETSKHGVTVERVALHAKTRGTRGLDAELHVQARKLFFATTLRIAAKLDIDAAMNATISGLRCVGDGSIGSLACGFLSPQLQKFDGRVFSLLALPLGEIRLRDVRLAMNNRITIHAEFGA